MDALIFNVFSRVVQRPLYEGLYGASTWRFNMKFKGLLLGSAAALLAVGGAQAADLPVKAKAVEYVKICSLYGAGFHYIPGTDTCIKLGGYLRAEVALNTNSDYNGQFSTN